MTRETETLITIEPEGAGSGKLRRLGDWMSGLMTGIESVERWPLGMSLNKPPLETINSHCHRKRPLNRRKRRSFAGRNALEINAPFGHERIPEPEISPGIRSLPPSPD
ncbi:Uncharacterized protein DAT39_011304 [Clarias magur]|uniref:Uncharacterized protein n=1 Tax=Clarias magur TaxID=1594786 RepID=A0A8J4U525_CLAMG|nr:Uncharacterized protein DAT39_011304 [Clarias magur]